jgi:hypothetical protein
MIVSETKITVLTKGLTALMTNAAMDPNPTREFIFGDPFLNALRPSTSKSAKDSLKSKINKKNYLSCDC